MNQADREKLDRLKREWERSQPTLNDDGLLSSAGFAYWLVRHSGWTVLPPGDRGGLRGPRVEHTEDAELGGPTQEQKLEVAAAFGSKIDAEVIGVDERYWRHEFAGRALQGLLARGGSENQDMAAEWISLRVKNAVGYADALIAELDKETR